MRPQIKLPPPAQSGKTTFTDGEKTSEGGWQVADSHRKKRCLNRDSLKADGAETDGPRWGKTFRPGVRDNAGNAVKRMSATLLAPESGSRPRHRDGQQRMHFAASSHFGDEDAAESNHRSDGQVDFPPAKSRKRSCRSPADKKWRYRPKIREHRPKGIPGSAMPQTGVEQQGKH